MKKLAIVALVLVAMSFVGCGLNSQLIGTWERTWSTSGLEYGDRYEFKRGGEFVYSWFVDGEDMPGYSGTWSAEGDQLTLVVDGEESTGKVEVNGDEMYMYYTDELYFTYTKK